MHTQVSHQLGTLEATLVAWPTRWLEDCLDDLSICLAKLALTTLQFDSLTIVG